MDDIVIDYSSYISLYNKKQGGPLPTGEYPTIREQINEVMSPVFSSIADKHCIDYDEEYY